MLICFKAEEDTKHQLDAFVRAGTYKDYSDVIAIAIRNLTLLHEEVGTSKAVVIGGAKNEAVQRQQQSPPRGKAPELFRRPEEVPTHEPAPLPDDAFAPNQEVPLDRWIFGQYSKLLPAKVSVRALANIELTEGPQPVESVASYIASEAAALTAYLERLDEEAQRQRDDALAVGFPSNARENAEKSRLRYANQFVGSVNKSGVLSGLLVDLKLVNITNGRTPRLQLTGAGWRWALARNPVLDMTKPNGEKFSQDERDLLIHHIHHHVPAEAFAYRAITRGILGGANTPTALDKALAAHVTAAKKDTITDAFITTQRSGVISRMADLGLIARSRDGVRVSYVPTDAGKSFVELPNGA